MDLPSHVKTTLNHLLFEAVNDGDIERARNCIDRGASIADTVSPEGKTPLIFCTQKQEMLEFLVQNGVDIDQEDKSGDTCLGLAVQQMNIERIKMLLDLGADPLRMPKLGLQQTPLERIRLKKNVFSSADMARRAEIIDLFLATMPSQKPIMPFKLGTGFNAAGTAGAPRARVVLKTGTKQPKPSS